MRTLFFLCFFALRLPFAGLSQSQSSVTIKTITIENGDTTVTEKSYNTDGDGIIFNDNFSGQDNPFIFFNKEYGLDTNFSENFDRIISREMQDFFKGFNNFSLEMPEHNMEFFNKSFPFDLDSAFSDKFHYEMKPDTTAIYKDHEINKPARPIRNIEILAENIIFPDKQAVGEFSAVAGAEEGSLKIVFQLDPKKTTQLILKDEKKKNLYKEKIPASKGMYTRLFDFSEYPSGNYFLELSQGKRLSASSIHVQKLNNNNFQFTF